MAYKDVYKKYEELKELLLKKKEAVIHNNLETMNSIDESIVVILEYMKQIDIEKLQQEASKEEKEALKALVKEIKNIQNDVEDLINHSMNVINNTLSGILNIALKDKTSYNAKGQTNQGADILSSITEEA